MISSILNLVSLLLTHLQISFYTDLLSLSKRNGAFSTNDSFSLPMYDHMHRRLLERKYLMVDETPIQVLKEPGRRPESKSYVLLLRTGEDRDVPIILYSYTPTRAGKNAAALLKNATSGFFLMTDGYKGYNKVPDA